jgi:DNA repair protein RecN (Recombination protein N)
MLTNIRIKNLAVVDDTTVRFSEGLNVITGETGAGKSMLADALQLLLGERADKSLIRTGAEQALAEAVFYLERSSDVDKLLTEAGMEPCLDGELIIRRTISSKGPGRAWINDTPTTVQLLKTIGNLLVDMHGPHEHQSLLNPRFQRDILDAFGNHTALLQQYQRPYQEMKALEAEREAYSNDDGDTAAQIDLLEYQIKELEQADLENTDEEELLQEHARMANASRIIELADATANVLTGEEHAAISAIASARRALLELADLIPEAEEWVETIESISIQTKDISNALVSMLNRMDIDPERLVLLEDRMALLQKLKRKYGRSVEDMRQFLERAKEKRKKLASRESRLEEIALDLEETEKQVISFGKQLREARGKSATKLEKQVTQHLRDLGFKHGQFSILVSPANTPASHGIDTVEFAFAPNPGEESRSLKDIASSGEISRVMLALKAVLAQHDKVPVLLFDEIDANLGGEMGNAVGQKLATVATAHQVLCITHLPQVAAFGQHHLVVVKLIKEGRTHVDISHVTQKDRVDEIARMLGGKDLTSVATRHAQELLDRTTSKNQ